ncbi:class II aldolase/adducin family protein [Altererythrobacter xixiisoli]|uniref:Class II aldolase/adducin family protein n=1 Tax=Croceibacterium xixiisoli TaxID=1476466 RepID=A0A6I4TT23_9SPHN|nr:class II aldolase/adducin family protein [Croceibacterium xixiisoli]MXO98027.1 class II aldolase/adducin family protein [Croceibacterium xixiisoli]
MATQIKATAPRSDAEWTARLELAACYRIFDMMGWSESIYNHITLRVPGEDAFLINPYGLLWSEVTASNLVKIDHEGNKLCDSPYPVNKAGFTQHGLFHAHCDWAHAIVHTHTPDTMAVCSSADGLTPTNFYACFFEGGVAYHDFEGITVRAEEGVRLLENLGDKRVLLLRNHGPVVLGETLYEMFFNYYMLQRACEIQVKTCALGNPIRVPPEVIAIHQRDRDEVALKDFGRADFEAWVRKLDTIDTGWRD